MAGTTINGGVSLSPDLAQRVAEFENPLLIEVYSAVDRSAGCRRSAPGPFPLVLPIGRAGDCQLAFPWRDGWEGVIRQLAVRVNPN